MSEAGDAGVDHQTPGPASDTAATLRAFLVYLRASVQRKLQGCTDDEARSAPVSSGTSLLGLAKHLEFVERYWVQYRLHGLDIGPVSGDGFALEPADDVASVLDAYRATGARSDELLAGTDLEAPAARTTHGLTAGWVLVHLVEETARHAGHADVLRELLDGSAGR
ncbi:MAG TPA: DinB family protein [Acidimicrobiales bacterium]|nr:DinB family protein [Acidimicrobiales bacterium]